MAETPRLPVTIRPERPGDHDAIAEVVAAAFGSPLEAQLVEAIRASEQYLADLALVAEHDGRVVGFVMVSHVELVDGDRTHVVASLSPLAVGPDVQRVGVGTALVDEAVRRADTRGEPMLVLEGSPAYYGRLGFGPAAAHGVTISLPSWAPPDAAQLVRLSSYEPSIRGHVRYPAAFDAVSEH